MRKRYGETQKRSILARKELEGLTYAELSRETGIPVSTLGYWKRKFGGVEGGMFEEIAVEDEHGARASAIEVVGPLGHRVLVDASFDTDLLRRVLESLPC